MSGPTRRDLLRVGAAGVAAGTAGCVQRTAAVSQDAARILTQTVPGLDRTEGGSIDLAADPQFPMVGADAQRSNAVPDVSGPSSGVEPGWRFASGQGRVSQPVVGNGTVAVVGSNPDHDATHSADLNLYALDPTSGELRFNFQGDTTVWSGAGALIRNGRVYMGSVAVSTDLGDGGVRLTPGNPDPEQRPDVWEADGSRRARSAGSPVATGGAVVTVGPDGVVAAFHPESGSSHWRTDLHEAFDHVGPMGGAAVSRAGYLCYGVSGTDGDGLGVHQTSDGAFSPVSLRSPPVGTPTVRGRSAYVACRDVGDGPALVRVDLAEPETTATREWDGVSAVAPPAVAGDDIVVCLEDGRVTRVGGTLETERWSTTLSARPVGVTTSADTAYVSVADSDAEAGGIVALALSSGDLRFTESLSHPLTTAPTVLERGILVGDSAGTVHGLGE
ncbi:MAG: PQQ-binding-like beta-propeller repeat protein [Halobacteriaceae archaeon]